MVMKQKIFNARVTFRKSPIHVLERFTLGNIENAYSSFQKHTDLKECVILQTCNRVEIFGSSAKPDIDEIKKVWASISGLEEHAFQDNLEWSKDCLLYTSPSPRD